MNRVFHHGEVEVRWCAGGLLVLGRGIGVLLDCPVGVEHYLGAHTAAVDAVVLSSGRLQAVGGLIGLLEAINRYDRQGRPLTIYSCIGEERGPALVECWIRDWPNDIEIHLDVSVPGRDICLSEIDIRTESIPHGEPLWSQDKVLPAVGVAVSLALGPTKVVWVPGSAPHPIVRRLCRGASLAVVEVAGLPWPQGAKSWRLTQAQAREAGAEADELWLVDDNGGRVDAACA